MRRSAALCCLAVALSVLAACSSNGSGRPSASTEPSTTVAPSSTVAPTTSTTLPVTTTTAPCHAVGTTGPVTTATAANAALLRAVRVTRERCADRVVFDFTTKSNAPPKCTIAYDEPPFYKDASGEPVTVSGSAFVRVRCEPAYGYDFETGTPTYTGPKQITATGTQHVHEVVETGDSEGVLNWIVGLDARRPFSVSTTTVTGPQAIQRLAIRFF